MLLVALHMFCLASLKARSLSLLLIVLGLERRSKADLISESSQNEFGLNRGRASMSAALIYLPGLHDTSSPGTGRKVNDTISWGGLFCLDVNYVPFGK